jgi:murein DD-endopeptidase MepM/ murein hydrolase activator NlpD
VFSSVFVSKTFPFQSDETTPVTNLSLPSLGAAPPEQPVLTSGVVTDTMKRQDLDRYAAAVTGVALPAEAASQAPPASPTAAPRPLFVSYTVQDGDTATSIASRFGLTLQYLLWNNPELRDGDALSIGDVLFIPTGNGILHYVSLGETISGIATHFGVGVGDIVGHPGNQLSSPDQVVEGQLLFVPNGVPPSSIAPEPTEAPVFVAAPTPVPRPAAPARPAPAATPPPAPPPPPPPPPAQVSSGSGLIWPFRASISRGIGGGHAGLDIAGFCCPNANIVAAHGGTVTFAGGSSCCGYGLYVDVRRSDGLLTRYAHLSRLHVSMGQSVGQGQSLGIIGETGNARGIHLHFEVRVNGSPVDPLRYLP